MARAAPVEAVEAIEYALDFCRRNAWTVVLNDETAAFGSGAEFNQSLEHAGRVADFLEFAELMCIDALTREESCGCHFREEHQTEENEAKRDDENFCYAAAWEHAGEGKPATLHKESLEFKSVKLTTRSYK